MCLQPTQQRFTTGKPLNHGFTTKMIVTLMLQLACLQLFLQSQQQSQHMGVYGQITDPSTVQIGDTVCFEGYVMDYYCIDRGTLLDNPSVSTLVGPDQHSVHCLVDVEECFTSPFELLADPITSNGTTNSDDGATLFTRAYRVDNDGRSLLIELARSHGSCGTCTGSSESDSTPIVNEGFRAEIVGIVAELSSGSGDGLVPVQVEVTDAKRSNNQATICGTTRATRAPAPTDVDNDKENGSINQSSNDTGVTALSVIVVLMAATLAIMSLYFGIVGSPNVSKSTTM